MKKVIFLLAVVVLFSGCAAIKSYFKTSLEITVVDKVGAIQQGAEVSIFYNKKDMLNDENSAAGPSYTDKKGRVKFKNLTKLKYWVKAEKGKLTNQSGDALETNTLYNGKKNKIIIVME